MIKDCDWRDPVPLEKINLTKLRNISEFDLPRIISTLESDRSEPRSSDAVEKDRRKNYRRKLDDAKTLENVKSSLAGYKNFIRASLDPCNTGQLEDQHIINMFIWKFACWCKDSNISTD